MLRAHSPVPHQYRVATQDVEVAGVTIPKGSVVQVSYLAGNQDKQQWGNPDIFDINRKGVKNRLGFGRGIHFCLGNQLARMEMRVALGRLLDRLENLRISNKHPEPQFKANFQVHALDSLNVEFTPASRLSTAVTP
tara:strand:+ start:212 stop:619 length:408 start_codon:yes stop_codon:yes gene_type:complete